MKGIIKSHKALLVDQVNFIVTHPTSSTLPPPPTQAMNGTELMLFRNLLWFVLVYNSPNNITNNII